MSIKELEAMKAMKAMEAMRNMSIEELETLSAEIKQEIKTEKDLTRLEKLRNFLSRATGEMASLRYG